MADVATFTALPPMRCCYQTANSISWFCGARADWMQPGETPLFHRFFCVAHRPPGCVPIAGELVFRRVTVRIDVLFAGVAPVQTAAQQEAVERLARAVETAGGLINLRDVSSTVGRWTPPAPQGAGKGRRGDPT